MAAPDLVMYEEEYLQIKDILHRLQVDSNSKIVFLVDKNGQQIASMGDMRGVDATSLASLTAGNVAATDGLAKLIGEKEFSILFHEGERDNIHISLVAQRVILVVIFDEKSSLGLVRLRVKKASMELEKTFEVQRCALQRLYGDFCPQTMVGKGGKQLLQAHLPVRNMLALPAQKRIPLLRTAPQQFLGEHGGDPVHGSHGASRGPFEFRPVRSRRVRMRKL